MNNLNFCTKGMTLSERYDLLKNIELIPVGTNCFESGGFADCTKPVIVTEENQKEITMFWNSLYFMKKSDADIETQNAHAEYGAWQASCLY